jgi:CRISPR/Cas system CMR subunit Cmr4 (Cas7 group RAMP superfamily)
MRSSWMVAGLVVAASILAGCKEASEDEAAGYQPARVVAVDGSDIGQVRLTADAVKRIDLQTATVEEGGRGGQSIIPHAAVFYGTDGETWTYTRADPLTFVREPITVDHIDADRAYLSEGPPAGTAVVTVGATELFGVETEVAG